MSPRILDQHGRSVFFPYDGDQKDLRKLYSPISNVSTIRNYGAKFGKAVAVEPGITNLETQSDFETQLRAWNPTDGDNAIGGTALTDGWRRYPKSGPTTTNTQIYHQVAYAVSTGQRLTVQCLFRFDGSRPTFDFNFDYNAGTDAQVTPTVAHLGKGVWHAMATTVVPASATTFRGLNLISLGWGTSTRIDLVEPIIHVHSGVQATITSAIRTSHVWGTRAGGNLTYDGWMLPRFQGTVSLWLRPNYDYTLFENSWRDLVRSITTASSDEFRFTIGANAGTPGELQCRFFAAAASQKAFGFRPSTWNPGQLYHVAISWSTLETVLYIDGVRKASSAGDFTRWSEAALVVVGGNGSAGSENADGLIDDLAIFRRQLSDAQIAAIHA